MTKNVTLNIDPRNVQTRTCLSPESFKEECPLNVLRFAKILSQIISSNVVYYDAFYWGGMVEYELAWIFGEKEEVIVQIADSKDQKQFCTINAESITHSEGNTLQTALKYLGVNMSSGYFLPHTRGFDWTEQRVR